MVFSVFDCWSIKPFALNKQKAGFISGKKGARRERRIFREINDFGLIGILSDLTNCLRYGDLLVFSKDGRYLLTEIKSGKQRSSRVRRQIESANNILTYLNTNKSNALYGVENQFLRISAHDKPIRNLSKLNKIILEAQISDNSYDEIEDGLFYIATYHFDKNIAEKISESAKGKVFIRLLDPDLFEDFAYYPLPLSINNPKALYEICLRKLTILVFLDCGVLKKKFEDIGFCFELIDDDRNISIILNRMNQKSKTPIELKIGHHLFNRIFTEFLSIDWFVKMIADIADKAVDTIFVG